MRDLLFDMNRRTMNNLLCGYGLIAGCGFIWYMDLLININKVAMNEKPIYIYILSKTF